MPETLIAFGANLGNPRETLMQTVEALGQDPEIEVLAVSSPITTPAVGEDPDQPPYTNAVIKAKTNATPESLLNRLLKVERSFGRKRANAESKRWQSRTIDLDLLLYADLVCCEPGLSIPHPRMTFRRFVLEPAVEVGADMIHPIAGVSIARLLQIVEKKNFFILLATHPKSAKSELQRSLLEKNSEFDLEFVPFVEYEKRAIEIEQEVTLPAVNPAIKICFIDGLAEFETVRKSAQLLVVADFSEAETSSEAVWLQALRKFPGPGLFVEPQTGPLEIEQVSREILSACQAMLPIIKV